MMKVAVLSLCLVLLVSSAPVADKQSKKDEKTQVHAAEHELQQLPGSDDKAIQIETTKTKSESSVNGVSSTKVKTETKVVKPGTGKVVADVQKIQTTEQKDGEKPKTKTEIDVPDQKVKSVSDGQIAVPNPLEFTPRAVAEYLIVTHDLSSFFGALEDLVKAKVMTVEDAKAYEEDVMEQYKLLMNEYSSDNYGAGPEYQEEYIADPSEYVFSDDDYPPSERFEEEEEMAPAEDDMHTFDIENMMRKAALQSALDRELDRYALLTPYLNEPAGVSPDDEADVSQLLDNAALTDEEEYQLRKQMLEEAAEEEKEVKEPVEDSEISDAKKDDEDDDDDDETGPNTEEEMHKEIEGRLEKKERKKKAEAEAAEAKKKAAKKSTDNESDKKKKSDTPAADKKSDEKATA